jgi:hypothetical protein
VCAADVGDGQCKHGCKDDGFSGSWSCSAGVFMGLPNMDAVDDRRLVWRSQDRRLVSELSPLHAMAVTADPRHQVRDGDFVNLGAVVSLGWPDWKLLSGSTVYRCGAN